MKKWWVVLIIGVLIIIPLAWYLISPLFISDMVNESIPFSDELSLGGIVGEENLVKVVSEGDFNDADDFHKTSGKFMVLEYQNETYLRLENFTTTNGPDLKVYFSSDLEASDYISLGDLKGNIGDQNYLIEGEDFENYPYVLIWCEDFSVLFGYAYVEER